MLTYVIQTGRLYDEDFKCKAIGYSGFGEGYNNPSFMDKINIGPIPKGKWKIFSKINSVDMGECVLPLIPHDSTNTFGRGNFYIHGDNKEHNCTASKGCIVLSLSVREFLNDSTDKILNVIDILDI